MERLVDNAVHDYLLLVEGHGILGCYVLVRLTLRMAKAKPNIDLVRSVSHMVLLIGIEEARTERKTAA